MWSWPKRPLTDGSKGLWLLLDQPSWTHRRVESLSFLPSGETRRRISWDFTLPPEFAIEASRDHVAVPIATLTKRRLQRLDVRDRSGGALPVWGREQNGELASAVLEAGLKVLVQHELSEEVRKLVREIVFAPSKSDVAGELEALFDGISPLDGDANADLVEAVRSVAETLADGFLFVVEVPKAWVGSRAVIKMNFDDDRLTFPKSAWDAIRGRAALSIETQGWSEAASWHLEVHAPNALNVDRLEYFVDDPARPGTVLAAESVGGKVSTAHVAGSRVPRGVNTTASVRFTPTTPGLLNQVTFGAFFALFLTALGGEVAEGIATRLGTPGKGASLVTVAFSVPAFLLALLSRTPEHQLVSRVLMAPRLVSFASALGLWSAGILLVWADEASTISCGLGALVACHGVLVVWAGSIRPVTRHN